MRLLAFSLVLFGVIFSIDGIDGLVNKARYDNYRIYRVKLTTSDHVRWFQELEERSDSYTFYGHARQIDQELTILVSPHKIGEFTDLLKTRNVDHKILTYNFQEKIDKETANVKPSDVPAADLGWENYYHLETIHAWMDLLVAKYKDIVSPLYAGQSFEGLPIKGVRLSHKQNNTAVFVEGGIHAREWISPATATYILDQLLTSNDSEVQDIAHNFDWYFFPIINPDGYRATFESDRMWRKTRQPFGLCRGTDLNRNWDSHWNETGASPDPCRYDYAGPSVFSEPESKALSEYILQIADTQHVRTYLSLHSFSQLLMFPYSSTSDKAPNYDDLKAIGEKTVIAMKQKYGTVYKTGSVYDTIYPSSGSSHDWAYSKAHIPISYTLELRGPPDSEDMFILPADQIRPTGEETLDGIVALLNEAKQRGYYDLEKIAASQNGAVSKHIQNFSMISLFIVFTTVISRIFAKLIA